MTIQHPRNCKDCGSFQILHPSYYDPQRLAEKISWVRERDPDLVELLETAGTSGVTVEHYDGDWFYKITKGGAVQAYPVPVMIHGPGRQERVGRTWRDTVKSVKQLQLKP